MTSRQNSEDRKIDTANNTDTKKRNTEDKMSEQKNTTIEQPDQMEDAAEESWKVRKSSPTPSEISDIADMLVSETMDQVSDNLNELLDSIARWKAEEERAESEGESSPACCTYQKVERNLTRFFHLRRVFAEHRGDVPEVTEEDLVPEDVVPEKDSTEEQETVTTQKKPVSRHVSKMYKKMKSMWKASFKYIPRKKKQSPRKEDLDETDESDDSDSKSDVTPEKFIKDADIDAPQEDKDICKTALAVTQETSPAVSTCSYDMSADPLMPSVSTLSGSTQLVEHREPSLVHLGAEKNVDETHSSDVRSVCSSHKQILPITSAGSGENIGAAETADRSSVLSDKLAMDFSMEEQCREETGRHGVRSVVEEGDLVTKTDSTLVLSGQDGPTSSNLKSITTCPEKTSPIVSISSSELTGLQNTFYTIIKEFFDSLTERQRTEISRGIYYMNVKDQLLDMCVDVLTVILQAITDTLTEAIRQNPTIFQHCRIETFKQELLSQLLWMKYDVADDNIQQTLGTALGMTFCDVVSAETSIKIPHKFKETIIKKITDEVIPAAEDGESSVDENTWCEFSTSGACKMLLSNVKTVLCCLKFSKQTSQTVSTESDAPTTKAQKKNSRCWKCFRKQWNKIRPASDKEMHSSPKTSVSTGQTPASSQDDKDKTTNVIKAPAQDPAVETKRPSLQRIQHFFCPLCCFSPGDIEQ